MEAKKAALSEKYAVVYLDTERSKSSYTVTCQQGSEGVGKTQFEQGCRQCAHFGALLNTSPDQRGNVTEDCCFNLECHKGKVAAYQASLKPLEAKDGGKEAMPTGGSTSKQASKAIAPAPKTTTTSAAALPPKVSEKIEGFYRGLAARTVTDDDRTMLSLNTYALYQFVRNGFPEDGLPKGIKEKRYECSQLDVFLVSGNLPTGSRVPTAID